jgi:predicted RNA-binding protein YlxR (DUF448 family)
MRLWVLDKIIRKEVTEKQTTNQERDNMSTKEIKQWIEQTEKKMPELQIDAEGGGSCCYYSEKLGFARGYIHALKEVLNQKAATSEIRKAFKVRLTKEKANLEEEIGENIALHNHYNN